jgi:EVE domain
MSAPSVARTWVVVASRDHARRGLAEGFIMANHGKRAPLARMSTGDRILVYSPKTTFPGGEPFQAIAIVGTVTGAEPEPSAVIPGGFRLRADLREITPIPLAEMRAQLPTSRIRFGCFELPIDDADTIWAMTARG